MGWQVEHKATKNFAFAVLPQTILVLVIGNINFNSYNTVEISIEILMKQIRRGVIR